MSIVGVSISSMDSSLSNLEIDFGSFNLESFGSGILAFCCIQILSVINSFLKYFRNTREKLELHLIIFNFSLSILSFIAICITCALYCISNVVFWMANFIIFSFIQILLIEPLYALLFYLVCRKRQIMKGKRITLPSEITSSKVSQVSYLSGFVTNETPTNRSLIKSSPRYKFS